jgi:hypothetical protein
VRKCKKRGDAVMKRVLDMEIYVNSNKGIRNIITTHLIRMNGEESKMRGEERGERREEERRGKGGEREKGERGERREEEERRGSRGDEVIPSLFLFSLSLSSLSLISLFLSLLSFSSPSCII